MKLLEMGSDVNMTTSEGKTPLMMACESGLVNVAVRLLDKGADVEAKDIHGKSALEISNQSETMTEVASGITKEMTRRASVRMSLAGGGDAATATAAAAAASAVAAMAAEACSFASAAIENAAEGVGSVPSSPTNGGDSASTPVPAPTKAGAEAEAESVQAHITVDLLDLGLDGEAAPTAASSRVPDESFDLLGLDEPAIIAAEVPPAPVEQHEGHEEEVDEKEVVEEEVPVPAPTASRAFARKLVADAAKKAAEADE
jgi:hypothetical protein